MDYSLSLPMTKEDNINYQGVVEVTNQTGDNKLYEDTYKIAKYFKRELNYDRVPFELSGISSKPYSTLLFTQIDYDLKAAEEDNHYTIYGACYFNKVNLFKEQHEETWVLRWVWIHPFFRNRGDFRKLWGVMEEKYGDFYIDKPVSCNMQKFLDRVESEHLIFDVPI